MTQIVIFHATNRTIFYKHKKPVCGNSQYDLVAGHKFGLIVTARRFAVLQML